MGRAVLLILLAGCGSSTPCAVCAAPARSPADEIALDWRIDGAHPIVHGHVARADVALVVDSGANQHMLERGVAWWLGLPQVTAEAVDAEGPVYASTRLSDGRGALVFAEVFGPTVIDTGLTGVALRGEIFTVTFPELAEAGIAGILSPQRLASDGVIEIDLRGSALRTRPRGAIERAIESGWMALEPACPTDDGVPLFTLRGRVEGHDVALLVDTGSDRTELYGATELTRALAARATHREHRATLADAGMLPVADGVRVQIAGIDRRIAMPIAIEYVLERCNVGGIVGTDVLRECTLLIGRDRAALRCAD